MSQETRSTGEALDDVLEFWNHRAGLGQWAGTNDITAKRLEMETLAKFVREGMRIIDVGCGNGITAMEIARRFDVEITGLDFSPEMIAAAKSLAAPQTFRGKVTFAVAKVPGLTDTAAGCDLVYTERTLINLPTWSEQEQAIREIGELVRPGGCFLMCENSQDGLDELNALRQRIGLPRIQPPWHNRYLRDREIESGSFGSLALEHIEYYSSTYYLFSRIVNAWLAQREGVDPAYDSPINELALQLPSIGKLGQGRLWIWRRGA